MVPLSCLPSYAIRINDDIEIGAMLFHLAQLRMIRPMSLGMGQHGNAKARLPQSSIARAISQLESVRTLSRANREVCIGATASKMVIQPSLQASFRPERKGTAHCFRRSETYLVHKATGACDCA